MQKHQKRFAQMYNQYADDIYRFIFVHVRDVELAEDLTADTFTSAWKSIEKFDNKQPRAWLYTIARNRMNDHWRKKQAVPLDENIEVVSEADLFEDIVDKKIQLKRVISALNTLPDEMKSVITLRFMQGLSAAETARSLGVTEGNVRVMQYRALKKLKEKLG
jgi:RNA polymerase sigma-70 factor (ECF subfamily)